MNEWMNNYFSATSDGLSETYEHFELIYEPYSSSCTFPVAFQCSSNLLAVLVLGRMILSLVDADTTRNIKTCIKCLFINGNTLAL